MEHMTELQTDSDVRCLFFSVSIQSNISSIHTIYTLCHVVCVIWKGIHFQAKPQQHSVQFYIEANCGLFVNEWFDNSCNFVLIMQMRYSCWLKSQLFFNGIAFVTWFELLTQVKMLIPHYQCALSLKTGWKNYYLWIKYTAKFTLYKRYTMAKQFK